MPVARSTRKRPARPTQSKPSPKTRTQKTDLERALSIPGALASSKTDRDNVHKAMKKARGAPVYDQLGYLITHKNTSGRRPAPRPSNWPAYEKWLEKCEAEDKRKAEIMEADRNKVSALVVMRWRDRVARDLDIPIHTVDMADFAE
jgi:hypothetical protein